MRISSECPSCHKIHFKLVVEGTTETFWKCDCGASWADVIIYPLWVLLFGQGIRHYKEKDYRISVQMLGSSYEVFQKSILTYYLKFKYSFDDEIIDDIRDLRIGREDFAKFIGCLMKERIAIPSAKTRNKSYHKGYVPLPSDVEDFASSVLQCMGETLNKTLSSDDREIIEKIFIIWKEIKPLPKMKPRIKFLFDLYTGISDLKESWEKKQAIGCE